MTRTRWRPPPVRLLSSLLLLLLCTCTWAKPMVGQPPKDIACPSDRIFGAVGTGDDSTRREWLKVEVEATSLQSCIKACYGYRYCYSVSFDPRLSTRPCVFYLHTSANCAARKLTPIGELSAADSSVFVECLKCATEEEALRDSSPLGVDYVKKTDLAGTKILFHTDGESDGEHAEEELDLDESLANFKFKAFKECEGEIVFRKAGERVTRELLHSMANSTLAGSSANCARACYSAENCKRAIYIPSRGMCAFDANEKTTDSPDCRVQTSELTSLPTPEAALLECIRCRKSKLANQYEGKSNDSPMGSGLLVADNAVYARACTVTFQVAHDLSALGFQPDQEATVASLNECAFICYQNSCTGAIYEPPTGTSNAAKCRIAVRQRENCSGALQNHYSFNSHTTVALSCFRCVPNRPTTLSPDAEIITSTISSLSPQQPEITEVQKGGKPQTDVESTIQLVHLKHGCSIAFQAESPDKPPKEFQSTFDTSLVVETADVCATRCYQDGCTGALFLPEQKLCKLGYGDRHSCSYGPLITHFVPATTSEQVWIHCVSCQTNLKNPKEVTLSRVTGGESTATPSPVAVGRDESRPATSESPGEYEASTTPAAGSVQPIEAPTTAEGDEKPVSSAQPQETTAESRVTSTPGELPPEAETEAPDGTSERPASSAEFATTQQPQEAPRGSTVPTDDLIPAEGVITTGEPREETAGAEQKEALTTILPVEASEQPVPTTQPSVEKLLTTAEQEIEKAAATASSILNEAVSKAQAAIEKAGDELKGTTNEPQQETTLVVGVTTAQPEESSGAHVEETAATAKPVIAEQAEGQTGQEQATTILPLQTTQSDAERLLTTAQESIESAASTAASVLDEGASTAAAAIEKTGEKLEATTSEPQEGGSSAVPLPTTLPAEGPTVRVTNAPPTTPELSEESVATSKPVVGLQQEGQTGEVEATTILPVQTTQSDAEKLLTTAQEAIDNAASTAASVIDEGVSTAKAAIQEAGQELKGTTSEPQEGSTLVVGVTSGAPEGTNGAEKQEQTTPVLAELVTSQSANPEASTSASVPAEQQEATAATGQPAGTSEQPQEATSGNPPAAPGEVVVVQTTQLPLETTQPSAEKLLSTAEQEIEKAAATASSILNEAVSKAQEAIEKAGDELKGTTSEPQQETTLQGTTVLITNAPSSTPEPNESTPAEVEETVATSRPIVGLQKEGRTGEQEATTPELQASTGPTVSERPAAELGEKGQQEANVETTPELPVTTPPSAEQTPATSARPVESTPSEAERLLTTAQDAIESAASTAASVLDEGASTAQASLEKAGDLLKSTTSEPEEPSTSGKVEIAVTTPEPQATTFEGPGATILETAATAKPAGGVEQQAGQTEALQTTQEVQATTLVPEQPDQTTQSDAEKQLTSAQQEIESAASTAASLIEEAASTAQAAIQKAGDELKATTSQPEESTLLVGLTTQPAESSGRTEPEATSGESATELPKTTIATEELLPQSVGRVEPTATSAPPKGEQATSRTEKIEASTPSERSEPTTSPPVGEQAEGETTILPVEDASSEGPQSTTPNSVEKALNSASEILQEAKENATNIIKEAVTKAQEALEKIEDKIEATTPLTSSGPAESTPSSLDETTLAAQPVGAQEERVATTILPLESTPSDAERLLTTAQQELESAASTAASVLDEGASTAEASIEKAGDLLKSTTSEPERSTGLPAATSSPSESGPLLVTNLPPSTPESREESVATPKPVIGLQQEGQTSQEAATTILPSGSTPSEAERLLSTAGQKLEESASTAASVLEEGASTAKEAIQKAGDGLKGTTAQPAEQQESTPEFATSSDNLATKEEQQTTPVVVVEVTSERPSSSELPVGGSTIPEVATTSGEKATTILPASSTPTEAERLLSTAQQEIEKAASTAASIIDEAASTAQASLEKAGELLKGTTSEPAESETSSRPSESPIVVGPTTAQPEASSGAPVDETAATSKPIVGLQQEAQTGEVKPTTILPAQSTPSEAERLLTTAQQSIENAASTAASILDEGASTAQVALEKARDELQATTINPEGSTESENEPQPTTIGVVVGETTQEGLQTTILSGSDAPAPPASTPSTEELLPKEREPVFITTSEPAGSTGGQEGATTPSTSGEEGESSELQTASTVRIWGTAVPVQEETTPEHVQETTQPPVTSAPPGDQQPTTEEPEESTGSTVEQRAQTVLILGTPAAPQNEEAGTTGAPATSSGEESTSPSVPEQKESETTNLPAEFATSDSVPSTTPNSVEKALNSASEILQEAKENATNIIKEAVTKAQAALEKIEDKIEGTTPMTPSEPHESTPAEVGETAATSRPVVGLQQEGQTGEQEATTPELEASTGPTVSERPAAELGEKGQQEASVETTPEPAATTSPSAEQPPATSALPVESTPSEAERLLTTAQQEIESAASTAASVVDEGASTAQAAIQKAGDLLKSTTSQPEESTLLVGLTTQPVESSERPEATTVESIAGVTSETAGGQESTTILPSSPVVLETAATSKPVIALQQEGQTGEAEATTSLPLQTTQSDAEKLLSTAEQEIREAASTAASVLDEGASTAQASLEKAGELLKGSTSEPAESETSARPAATSSPSESETLLVTNAPPTTPEGPPSTGAPVEETARTARPVVGLQQEGQTGRVEATTILPEQPAQTTQSDTEKQLTSLQQEIESAASTAASIIDEAASTARSSIEKAGELLKGTTSEPQEGSTLVIGVTTGGPESTNEVEVTTGPSQRETTLVGVPVTSAGPPEGSTLLITNAPPTSAEETGSTPLVKVADESALPTESSANVLTTSEGEEATTQSAEASSLPPIKSEVSSAIPPLTNQPEVATTLPPIGGQSTAIVQEGGSTQEPKQREGLTTIFPQSGTSEPAEHSTIAVVGGATSESHKEQEATTILPASPVVLETSATSKPVVGLQQEGETGRADATTILPPESTPSEAERLLTTAEQEIREAASTAASVIDEAASTAQASIEKAGDILKGTTSEPAGRDESTAQPSESGTILITNAPPTTGLPVDETAATAKPVIAEQAESRTGDVEATTILPPETTQSDSQKLLSTAEQEIEAAASTAASVIQEGASTAKEAIQQAGELLKPTTSEPQEGSTVVIGVTSGAPESTNEAEDRTTPLPANLETSESALSEARTSASVPAEQQEDGASTSIPGGPSTLPDEAATRKVVVVQTTELPLETTPSNAERLLSTAQQEIGEAASTAASIINEAASTAQSAIQKAGELVKGSTSEPQEGETTGLPAESGTILITNAPPTSALPVDETAATSKPVVGLQQEGRTGAEEPATTILPLETTPSDSEKLLSTAEQKIEEAASTAASVLDEGASTAAAAIEKAGDLLKSTTSEPQEATPESSATSEENGETSATPKPVIGLQQEGSTGRVRETTFVPLGSSEQPTSAAGEEASTAVPLGEEKEGRTTILPAEEPISSTQPSAEKLLSTAEQEIEKAASTAASILNEAVSKAQATIEKAGDELKGTTHEPHQETSTPPSVTSQVTDEEPAITLKPSAELQQEGQTRGEAATTGQPEESSTPPAQEGVLSTEAPIQTTGQPEEPLATTQSESEKLLTTAQESIEKAASTAASVLEEGASTAQEAIQKAGDLLKTTQSPLAQTTLQEVTGTTLLETVITAKPPSSLENAGQTKPEDEGTTPAGQESTGAGSESAGSGFATATQENEPPTTLGAILETSTPLHGLEIAKTNTEELLPPGTTGGSSAETTEQPSSQTAINNELQSTTAEPPSGSSTTLPDIVRAVSELVDAIGRNKNNSATTPEPPVEAVSQLVQTLSKHGDVDGILRGDKQGGFGNKGCAGSIQFSGTVLTDYAQPFEMILASDTIKECARVCYDLGCTRAAFTRFPRPACLLHFEEHELKLTQRCSANERLNSTWRFTRNEEAVQLLCVKCGENIQKDEGSNEVATPDEEVKQSGVPKQGYTNVCNGRVEFHIAAVASLPKLNVTNDVQSDSPADCARKCLEQEGCTTAGFVPISSSPTGGGVCLMTSDVTECLDDVDYHPQHASTVPFVLSCIKCSKCDYALSAVTPNTPLLVKFDRVITVRSLAECAERCAAEHCGRAQFDPTNLSCSMISAVHRRVRATDACPPERAVDTSSIFPVLLDCVQCSE